MLVDMKLCKVKSSWQKEKKRKIEIFHILFENIVIDGTRCNR